MNGSRIDDLVRGAIGGVVRNMKPLGNRRHIYRRKAMGEFGKSRGRELCSLSEMVDFLNNYLGVSGKNHKNTGTHTAQLISLIKQHPDFRYYPNGPNVKSGLWKYIGEMDEEE